jgi:prepilin-type N-terminal cleavage/methylation domain-containing protein
MRKGFTLIELLVVIAIIGILAVIVVKSVSKNGFKCFCNSELETNKQIER